MFHNMKISTRLILSFLLITVILGTVTFIGNRSIEHNLNRIVNALNPAMSKVFEIDLTIKEAGKDLVDYLAIDLANGKGEFEKNIAEIKRQYDQFTNIISTEDQASLVLFDSLFVDFQKIAYQIIEANETQKSIGLEIESLFNNNINTMLDKNIQPSIMSHDELTPLLRMKLFITSEMEINAFEFLSSVLGYQITSKPALKKRIDDSVKEYEQAENNYRALSLNSEEKKSLDELKKYWDRGVKLAKEIIRLEDEIHKLGVEFETAEEALDSYLDEYMVPLLVDRITNNERHTLITIHTIQTVTVITYFLVIIIGFLVSRSISRPIAAFIETTQKIGEGKFDRAVINIDSNDEIGMLARSFNRMSERLNNSREKLKKEISERKRVENIIASERNLLRTLIDNLPDSVYVKDEQSRFLVANKTMARRVGYPSPDALIGKTDEDVYPPDVAKKTLAEDAEILKTGKPIIKKESIIFDKSKKRKIINLSTKIPLKDNQGKMTGLVGTGRDITEQRKAEERIERNLHEKELLLKEIHHRVKNNLTIITSLLNLQTDRIIRKEDALKALNESRDRVYSMALVHEKLYKSEDFASVDMQAYIHDITRQLVQSHQTGNNIKVNIEAGQARLDINTAIPCGLILNEIITNSFKHAFPEGRDGELHITFAKKKGGLFLLRIADNGIGLPTNFDIDASDTLGMTLIKLLSDQLSAELAIKNKNGTAFEIRFH